MERFGTLIFVRFLPCVIALQALVVSLGTDHSPGDQVNFYLQAETDISSGSTNGLARFIKPDENTSSGAAENTATGLSQKLVSEHFSPLRISFHSFFVSLQSFSNFSAL